VKRKLVVIGVVLMVLFIGTGGCDESDKAGCSNSKDNYVNVIVEARVHVTVSDNFYEAPWTDALLDVEIDKSGGERVSEQKTTDSQGDTSFIRGTFKVYREQSVSVCATVIGGPMPEFMGVESWDPEKFYLLNNCETLSWGVISETDWGGTHYWYPTVDLRIFPQ